MKKKITMIILAAGAAMIMLGACTRSDSSSAGSSAGAAGSAASSQNTAADAGNSGNAGAADAGNTQDNQAQAADSSQGASQDSAQDAAAEDTYDMQNQAGEEPAAPSGQDTDGTQWDGTYVSSSGETLTVKTVDEYTISFQFANSGISGSASAEGEEAVYYGDDDYEVVFSYYGGSIEVVAGVAESETEEMAEPSAIDGNYIRQ